MEYAKTLKELFSGITLNAEDLLQLETFQIKYLPDRVPKKEFASLLRVHPIIHRFLISKDPNIENFITKTLNEFEPESDINIAHHHSQELLWEIADLIVYNKYPEVYDTNTRFNWSIKEINDVTDLRGKIVVDAGAGTGQLAFLVAKYAKTVFAVEPVTSFRRFMRKKALDTNANNLYVHDGFLDSIPLPDCSVDLLMTSNAIGWNLDAELIEIERVLNSAGNAVHLFRIMGSKVDSPIHDTLVSDQWGYSCKEIKDDDILKLIYSKSITPGQ